MRSLRYNARANILPRQSYDLRLLRFRLSPHATKGMPMIGRIPIDGITADVPILNGQQAACIIDRLNRFEGNGDKSYRCHVE